MEVGAGTFHPATTLRALGPKPWNAAYVQPSRRPKDGRYGENPNRLQHYYQFQVILKPSPPDIQELYLNSLKAIGIDPKLHDIRFVEDDWESPTLGAWGLGWECWCDGMEVSQFTYFQQVAGFECAPVAGELTYGLERLAMYVQGVDNVFDLNFNGRSDDKKVTYGDVFLQAEQEYSRHNFEFADTAMLFEQFKMAEAACQKYSPTAGAAGPQASPDGAAGLRPVHQGEPRVQSARRARRHLGDRAAELYPARARTGESLRRGLARDRRRRGVSAVPLRTCGEGKDAPLPLIGQDVIVEPFRIGRRPTAMLLWIILAVVAAAVVLCDCRLQQSGAHAPDGERGVERHRRAAQAARRTRSQSGRDRQRLRRPRTRRARRGDPLRGAARARCRKATSPPARRRKARCRARSGACLR